MAVLMIRAGAHERQPPETVLVLESEVEAYRAKGWVRVGTDPGRLRLNPPRWKPDGSTGE